MPVLQNNTEVSDVEVGTKLRFIGSKPERVAADLTVGDIYTVAGSFADGDVFVIDDIGDKNYAASSDGAGNFEIVKEETSENDEVVEEWWASVIQFLTDLSKDDRATIAELINEIEELHAGKNIVVVNKIRDYK